MCHIFELSSLPPFLLIYRPILLFLSFITQHVQMFPEKKTKIQLVRVIHLCQIVYISLKAANLNAIFLTYQLDCAMVCASLFDMTS